MEKKNEYRINYKKYRNYCLKNNIPIPFWMSHVHFKQVITLMCDSTKLHACKYLCDISTQNGTRNYISDNPEFGLKWAKSHVCDVIDLFKVVVPEPEIFMKKFDNLCREIDWEKMAKSRKTVKNLAEKKPQLKYLVNFLDELANVAVESEGVKLSSVYPSAGTARLIKETLEKERIGNIVSKSFFEAQNKKRKEENK